MNKKYKNNGLNIFLAFVIALTFSSAEKTLAAPSEPPVGSLESFTADGSITGWALDPDDISQAVTINIYFDIVPSSSRVTPALSVLASVSRSDLGAHGFSATAPASLKDGQTHSAYIYALDLSDNSGGSDILLTDSPMSVVLTALPAPAPSDTTAPAISAISSSNISQTAATITWITNEPSDTQVEYGSTTSYGSVTTLNSSAVTSHSVTLSNLSANTLYNFRVKSRDAAGNLATSVNATFTTLANVTAPLDTTAPVISAVAASGISQTGATVTWTTNESSDTQVEYGTTTGYGTVTTLDILPVISHSVTLSNLSANTLYNFRVKSRDVAGNLATSTGVTFTTLAMPIQSGGGGGGSSGGGGGSSGGGGGSSGGGGGSVLIPQPVTPASQPISSNSVKMKLINDNGTYFLVQNNQRQGITNPGMLASYGFSFAQAKIATNEDKNLPQGALLTPANGSLVKSMKDKTVYLISGQQRHAFTSSNVFLGLGFKFSSVLIVTDPELQILPKAGELADKEAAHLPGLDINKDGTIYWIGGDSKLYPYPSVAVYNTWHVQNDFSRVVTANAADRQKQVGEIVMERYLE